MPRPPFIFALGIVLVFSLFFSLGIIGIPPFSALSFFSPQSQLAWVSSITAGNGLQANGLPGGTITTKGTISLKLPISVANGGTGTNISPQSGSLLIGNGSGGYAVSTLSAGSGIAITNGIGTITIANTGVTPNPTTAPTGWINVMDSAYGAVGDGVHDDTKAINAAIQAAGDNSTIFFPSHHNYLVDAPINLTNNVDHVTVEGGGATIACNTGTVCLDLTGINNTRINDLRLISYNSYSNPSTVGILMARTPKGNRGFYSDNNLLDNVVVVMASNPSANNSHGTVGLYDNEAEVNTFHACTFGGDTGFVTTYENIFGIQSPFWTNPDHVSNSDIAFTGATYFIAYSKSDLYLDDIFGLHIDWAYFQSWNTTNQPAILVSAHNENVSISANFEAIGGTNPSVMYILPHGALWNSYINMWTDPSPEIIFDASDPTNPPTQLFDSHIHISGPYTGSTLIKSIGSNGWITDNTLDLAAGNTGDMINDFSSGVSVRNNRYQSDHGDSLDCSSVSGLLPNPRTGTMACVSDYNATTYGVCSGHGGGSHTVSAIYDGSAWQCM